MPCATAVLGAQNFALVTRGDEEIEMIADDRPQQVQVVQEGFEEAEGRAGITVAKKMANQHVEASRFQAALAARELHWFRNGRWENEDDEKQRVEDDRDEGRSTTRAAPPLRESLATLHADHPPWYAWFNGKPLRADARKANTASSSTYTNAAFNEVDRWLLRGCGDCVAFVHEPEVVEAEERPAEGREGMSQETITRRTTYRDLFLHSCLASEMLREAGGLKLGDRVLIVGPNVYDHVVFVQGCKRAGIIYSCLPETISAEIALDRMKQLGAKAVVLIFPRTRSSSSLSQEGLPFGYTSCFALASMDHAAQMQLKAQEETQTDSARKNRCSNMLELAVRLARGQRQTQVFVSDMDTVATCGRMRAGEWVKNNRNAVLNTECAAFVHEQRQGQARGCSAEQQSTRGESLSSGRALIEHFGAPQPVDPNWPMCIVYTSGSTGPPKPIVHAHAGLLTGVCASFREIFGIKDDAHESEAVHGEGSLGVGPKRSFRADDKLLVLATPAWITGQSYMISAALAMGIPSVLLEGSPVVPRQTRFAEVIARHKVTLFKAGSTFLRGVMGDHAARSCGDNGCSKSEAEDSEGSGAATTSLKTMCASLRVGVFCAEPVNPAVHKFASEHLCANFRNCYWGTEHGSIVFASPEGALPGHVGTRPLSWVFVVKPEVEASGAESDGSDHLCASTSKHDAGSLTANGSVQELRLALGGGASPAGPGFGAPFPSLARTIWGDARRFDIVDEEPVDESRQEEHLPLRFAERTSQIMSTWRGNLRLFKKTYFPAIWVREQARDYKTSLVHTLGPKSEGVDVLSDPPAPAEFVQGDSIFYDAEKDLYYFLGRSDDVLNVGGVRVGTGEIESALLQKQKSLRLCVTAGPDKLAGQVPVVFYEKTPAPTNTTCSAPPAHQPDLAGLREAVRTYVGQAAVPKFFIPVPELPHTITGKFTRGLLRKLLESVDFVPQSVATLRNAAKVLPELRRCIRKHFLGRAVSGEANDDPRHKDLEGDELARLLSDASYDLKTPLIKLGLDSLDLVRLRDSLAEIYGLQFENVTAMQTLVKRSLRGVGGLFTKCRPTPRSDHYPSATLVATLLAQEHLQKPAGLLQMLLYQKEAFRDRKPSDIRGVGISIGSASVMGSICRSRLGSQKNRFLQKAGSQLTTRFGGLRACKMGDLDKVRSLLARSSSTQSGSDAEQWDPRFFLCKLGSSALHWACSSGSLELVKMLCEWMVQRDEKEKQGSGIKDRGEIPRGSSSSWLNAQNKDGRTPLMFAAKYGHLAIVRYLLEELLDQNRIDLAICSKDGSNAFDWAVFSGDLPLIEYLYEKTPDSLTRVNKFGCTAVHWAASSGRVPVLHWLAGKSEEIFQVINDAGHGCIVKAAWKGHREALEFLLGSRDGCLASDVRWQIDRKDNAGLTAWELAKMAGHNDLSEWLRGLAVVQPDEIK
eukprot:g11834.t1